MQIGKGKLVLFPNFNSQLFLDFLEVLPTERIQFPSSVLNKKKKRSNSNTTIIEKFLFVSGEWNNYVATET